MADVIHDVLLKAQRSLGISHPTARAAMAQAAQHIVRQDDEISRLRGEVERLRKAQWPCIEIRKEAATLRAANERLSGALEWALDNCVDSDHPSYPVREDGKWTYPYLVSNAGGFGGGVGNAYFPTALEAVEAAALTATQEKRNGNG